MGSPFGCGSGAGSLPDGVVDGDARDFLASLAGDGAGDDVRAVLDHLFGVEAALAARDALYHDARLVVD